MHVCQNMKIEKTTYRIKEKNLTLFFHLQNSQIFIISVLANQMCPNSYNSTLYRFIWCYNWHPWVNFASLYNDFTLLWPMKNYPSTRGKNKTTHTHTRTHTCFFELILKIRILIPQREFPPYVTHTSTVLLSQKTTTQR